MNNLQIEDFTKSVVYEMEGCDLLDFSDSKVVHPIKDKAGNVTGSYTLYQLSYSTMQNGVTNFAGNHIAQADFEQIMENEVGKVVDGKMVSLPEVVEIMQVAEAGKKPLNDRQKAIVQDALKQPENLPYIQDANNAALERVNNYVNLAFNAANSQNPNGPGAFNRVAPDPYLLAEVAAWINQTGDNNANALVNYFATAKNISLGDFENQYLTNRDYFQTNSFGAWFERILNATNNAEDAIGATVDPFNGSVTASDTSISNTGPNYLSMFKNASGNWDGFLQ